MKEIAYQTGGRAFYDTNLLDQAAAGGYRRWLQLLHTRLHSGQPTDWNGTYRKIVVRSDRPKVNLSYRRGCPATSPTANAQGQQAEAAQPTAPPRRSRRACRGHASRRCARCSGRDPDPLLRACAPRGPRHADRARPGQ